MFLLLDAVLFYLYHRGIEIIKIDLFILVCNWWRWLLYCGSSYFYCGFEIYPFFDVIFVLVFVLIVFLVGVEEPSSCYC